MSFYVRVEFANITVITERYRDNIEEMKKNFARIHDKYIVGIEGKESWGFTPVPKYTHVSLFVTIEVKEGRVTSTFLRTCFSSLHFTIWCSRLRSSW